MSKVKEKMAEVIQSQPEVPRLDGKAGVREPEKQRARSPLENHMHESIESYAYRRRYENHS